MKFTYDPRYNIAYIRFSEKKAEAESIRLSDEITVDIGSDGILYGIELLNASEQLQRDDAGDLIILNEATGHETRFSLMGRTP